MIKTAKHYLICYQAMLQNSLAQELSFRFNFIGILIIDSILFAVGYGSALVYYEHLESIGSWGRDEYLFFTSFSLLVETLRANLTAANCWRFSSDVRTGELDYFLIRPIGSLFGVFFHLARPTVITGVIPAGLLIFYGIRLELSPLSWMLLPLFVVASFVLLVLTQILVMMLMFWTVEGSGINFLRIQSVYVARWPDFAYQGFFRVFFLTIFPILLVYSAPVHTLIDGSAWNYLVGFGAALVVQGYLVRIFWMLGLRRYESASS